MPELHHLRSTTVGPWTFRRTMRAYSRRSSARRLDSSSHRPGRPRSRTPWLVKSPLVDRRVGDPDPIDVPEEWRIEDDPRRLLTNDLRQPVLLIPIQMLRSAGFPRHVVSRVGHRVDLVVGRERVACPNKDFLFAGLEPRGAGMGR